MATRVKKEKATAPDGSDGEGKGSGSEPTSPVGTKPSSGVKNEGEAKKSKGSGKSQARKDRKTARDEKPEESKADEDDEAGTQPEATEPTRSSRRKRAKVNYSEAALEDASSFGDPAALFSSRSRGGGGSGSGSKSGSKSGSGSGSGSGGGSGSPHTSSAGAVEIEEETQPLPTRGKDGFLHFRDHKEFRPNMSPKEVLQAGSFGGTYFRPIASGVLGKRLSGMHKELPKDWIEGLDVAKDLTSSTYREGRNKYGVKCGGSLEMWESSGWITEADPYGWFQWYCRFYMGRRSSDDDRQISRWSGVAGPKGRFRNQLIGKCARSGKRHDDSSVSPVIRQTLQHWGYVLTKKDADQYVKLKGLPKLPA